MNSAVRAQAVGLAHEEQTSLGRAPGFSAVSLDLVLGTRVPAREPIVDVSGHPLFVCELLRHRYKDVTVVNASSEILRRVAAEIPPDHHTVTLLKADVLDFRTARKYRLWHDESLFQALSRPEDRVAYRNALNQAVSRGGYFVVSAFGLQAPASRDGVPVARYDQATLEAEFSARFSLEKTHASLEAAADGSLVERVHAQFRRR